MGQKNSNIGETVPLSHYYAAVTSLTSMSLAVRKVVIKYPMDHKSHTNCLGRGDDKLCH